jgi:hypothetical protein
MQNRNPLLGFLIKRIRAAKGTWLALIKPLYKFSTKYYFMAYSLSTN